MKHTLTLICNPRNAALTPEVVMTARSIFKHFGCDCGNPDWLSGGIACDIPISTPDDAFNLSKAEAALRETFKEFPIDLAVQQSENRRKRLLIADMDSTIVIGETLDELADFAGCKDAVAATTRRAMNGEIDFAEALRERVALLKGLPADSLKRTYERIELTPGAETLIKTMAAFGAKTMLVSGGFTYFTERISRRLGFDGNQGNVLEIADGGLTGQVLDPILDKDSKLKTLKEMTATFGLEIVDTLAVGDGANDLPMIMTAGLGVAFQAKPTVAKQAKIRIEHADLTALLYLQGYRESDIVAP